MWSLSLCLLVCVLSPVTVLSSCPCAYTHPQQYVCNADFVIQASVLSVNPADPEETYPADRYHTAVLRVFKVFQHPEDSLVINNFTTTDDVVYLYVDDEVDSLVPELRVKYVLGGRILGTGLHLGVCDLSMPWDDLTEQQRRGFHQKYGNNCGCQIKSCQECTSAEVNECVMTATTAQCHGTYGACELQEDGHSCSWTNPSELRACLRGDTEEEEADDRNDNQTKQRWLRN